jgi:hypothetical protein
MLSNEKKLHDVITEAKKIIKLAEIAIDEIKQHQKWQKEHNWHTSEPCQSRKYARVKRQSMELQEALVVLRGSRKSK